MGYDRHINRCKECHNDKCGRVRRCKRGPRGPQGVQGPAGADGAQGPQGIQGFVGPAGADGAQGPQGIQGFVGPAGADGAQGPPGIQGPPGLAGPPGIQGPPGAQLGYVCLSYSGQAIQWNFNTPLPYNVNNVMSPGFGTLNPDGSFAVSATGVYHVTASATNLGGGAYIALNFAGITVQYSQISHFDKTTATLNYISPCPQGGIIKVLWANSNNAGTIPFSANATTGGDLSNAAACTITIVRLA